MLDLNIRREHQNFRNTKVDHGPESVGNCVRATNIKYKNSPFSYNSTFRKKVRHRNACSYHTITDVYTTAWLLTKPSSDDDSGFRNGFGAEASLPIAQSTPAVSHDTTKLCQIDVALWDYKIYADAVRVWDLFYIFPLVCIYAGAYICQSCGKGKPSRS